MTQFDEGTDPILSSDGSIDFHYYDTRARELRAAVFAGIICAFRARISANKRLTMQDAIPSPCPCK